MRDLFWIVIVNYRTAELAVDCLRSIAAQLDDMPEVRVVVVDNASPDGSRERLEGAIAAEGWQGWAALLPLDNNGGFASGNNAGIRLALQSDVGFRFVMLLNPDTVVRKGALRALAGFMDAHPKAGIAGSGLENANGSTESSAHTAISPLGELESSACLGILSRVLRRYAVTLPGRDVAHPCDWVSGASLIVRREVLEEIGFLDEGYFLYFEEADFCARARKSGWEVWFVPESRVVHLEGASTGIRETMRRRPQYWFASRRRYFVKHFGLPGLVLADALWAMGRVVHAIHRALRLGSGGGRPNPRWFAFDLLWGDLQSVFSGQVLRIRRDSTKL